jgi:hypothetical protein
MQNMSLLASKAVPTTDNATKQPPAPVPGDEVETETETINHVGEAFDCQVCYICGDMIRLDRNRTWQYVEPFSLVIANY